MGYTHVSSMAGGITRWKDTGQPVVRERQLSAEQLERYSRHFLLSQVGESGQGKLLDAKVLLVGAGGLDPPRRCIWRRQESVRLAWWMPMWSISRTCSGRSSIPPTALVYPRSSRGKQALNALNPDVRVVPYNERLTTDNVMDIFRDYDVIVDGCDNFPTRYLVNDAAVLLGENRGAWQHLPVRRAGQCLQTT